MAAPFDRMKHPRGQGGRFSHGGINPAHEAMVLAVGGPAAVGASRYTGGLAALKKLKSVEAAGQLRGIARSVEHVRGPLPNEPRRLANGLAAQHISRTRNKLSPDPFRRKLVNGATEWEFYRGMNKVRAAQHPGLLAKLSPNYSQRKVFLEAVRNAPASPRELHRGIAVDTETFEREFQPGQIIRRGHPESWSESPYKAERHSIGATSAKVQHRMGTSTGAESKSHRIVLHAEPGHPALNIQGLGRMGQGEWVSSHPYQVIRREGDHVYVKTIQKSMSDAELRRRKKLQGHISQTTATLGLAALGSRALGTKAAGRLTRIPAGAGERLKNASTALTTTGAGIGGVGGYNFAAYTKAEAQRKQSVRKDLEMLDFGLDGVRSGRNIVSKAAPMNETGPRSKVSMEKLPTTDERVLDAGGVPQQAFVNKMGRPVGRSKSSQGVISTGATKISSRPNSVYKAYDPERNRQRRLEGYSTAAAVGAGAAGAGSAHYGAAAVRAVRGQKIPKFIKMAGKNAGRSAGLGAAAVGGAVAANKIRSYKQNRGRSFSPMRTSNY